MSAHFAEFFHKVFYGKVFLFLAGNITNNFAFVHHNKAVAVFNGVAHIMGDHKCGKFVFGNNFFGDFKNFCGGFGVK